MTLKFFRVLDKRRQTILINALEVESIIPKDTAPVSHTVVNFINKSQLTFEPINGHEGVCRDFIVAINVEKR